jgi:hypothetical protein
METLNRNHISYQEMDGLIELAEKVSVNLEALKDDIKTKHFYIMIYLISILTITFSVISRILWHFLNTVFNGVLPEFISILLGSILVAGFYQLTILKFREVTKAKTTINREEKNLRKLLNMIEGYKELYVEDEYGNNNSVLSKALFEMRLSRINFGVK